MPLAEPQQARRSVADAAGLLQAEPSLHERVGAGRQRCAHRAPKAPPTRTTCRDGSPPSVPLNPVRPVEPRHTCMPGVSEVLNLQSAAAAARTAASGRRALDASYGDDSRPHDVGARPARRSPSRAQHPGAPCTAVVPTRNRRTRYRRTEQDGPRVWLWSTRTFRTTVLFGGGLPPPRSTSTRSCATCARHAKRCLAADAGAPARAVDSEGVPARALSCIKPCVVTVHADSARAH